MKILYKAISKDTGEWVYGFYLENNNKSFILGKGLGYVNSDGLYGPIEVIPETVCRYIGKEDENDHKLFGGDTVNTFEGDAVIVWKDLGWRLKFDWEDEPQEFETFVSEIKRTGNIHDKKTSYVNRKV